jgi:spermidine/putrescine ABC transporter ATP-binding subunit
MSIELKNIVKRYGNTTALDNVSLEIKNGEFMTLLGPSGCGKTTLLRIIAGFVQPDEGDVLLDGIDIKHLRPNKRPTGMVFQSYALFPHMNVNENIAFGLRMHKFEKGDMKKRIDQVMELAGIVELKDRFPSQLSGGQQQRVALARTLALQPKVLLLDEPLAALDRKLRTEMRGEVRRIVDKVGITTIFVTHDQEEALTMSDRIAVMNKGVIIQCGTPMEIYDTPQTAFVASFIGDSNLYHGVIKKEAAGYMLESPQIRFPVPDELVGDYSGETIVLLRPEHLRIALSEDNGESKNGMKGVITYVTHLGESIKYDVLLERGASINVQVHRSRAQMPFPQGADVVVSPINSDSFLFVRDR